MHMENWGCAPFAAHATQFPNIIFARHPMKFSSKILPVSILLALSSQAQAAPNAQAVLEQLNLVVSTTLSSTSHVDGRTYVGGNATGNGAVFAMHADAVATPSSYKGLTVGGNLGGSGTQVNNSAGAVVGGTASNLLLNGGGPVSHDIGAVSSPVSTMLTLATNLKSLDATLGTSVSYSGSGKATFKNTSSADFVVFDLTSMDAGTNSVFKASEFDFNLGGAKTVIFNTDETAYSINANFLGGVAASLGSKAIWNFYNAETISLGSQFGGSLLAMNAALSNANNIEGGVYVESLVQSGEIHYASGGFKGNIAAVPEPETYAMLLAGLGMLAAIGRRKTV
jgi:choice-of-anchor A domain-containing protein